MPAKREGLHPFRDEREREELLVHRRRVQLVSLRRLLVDDKVREATNILKSRLAGAQIIGNIQLDAALDYEVLKIKYPEASFTPPANVLIFPNLDAANIGYKLVQRFSGAKAIGPILQGLAKPVNDLSRGCSVDEIVNTVVITANQCS